MGRLTLLVLLLEAIPLGVLVGITRDRWQRRRPQFGARFARLVFCVALPELVLVALFAVRLVGERAGFVLLVGGFCWGVLLVALAPLWLFEDPGSSPGQSDDDGDGPGPGDDRPPPRRPIGGISLPDAEQSPMRIRVPALRTPEPARERAPVA